jgi:AraC-like DNA-binding protein
MMQMSQRFTELNRLKLKFQLEGFSSEMLSWGFYSGDEWWRNYLHVHSFFEICYVFRGQGQFLIHNQTHAVKSGDLFIAKPDQRHEIISSKLSPLGIYFWSYTLVPPKQHKTNDLSRLFYAFMESDQWLCPKQKNSERILELLLQEVMSYELGYTLTIENLAKQLIIETARASTPMPALRPVLNHRNDVVSNTIMRYLRDNYNRTLSLKDIAAQVHLSERHISRLFKKTTGSSIKQYATQLKMDVAKQLLLDASRSVSDVAYEVGFQDVRHFSTTFRYTTGISPSQYRQRQGTTFI